MVETDDELISQWNVTNAHFDFLDGLSTVSEAYSHLMYATSHWLLYRSYSGPVDWGLKISSQCLGLILTELNTD